MSNKDIILDSFSRLLTNVRESRTFIHSMAQIRKTYRRTRHSQPPPLSQQLFALQRHYLELCSTIAFTPSSTPPSDSQDPSSPRVWTEKHPNTFNTRNTNTSVTAGTPPTEGESRDRRGQYSPLLNEMRWDNDNKQWIGNYTDADKFHNFGTIKPVTEENDSLIAKIAEAADMWYDAKEFKWKKCKKKTKPNQKITTILPPKTLVKPPPEFLPQQQRREEKEKVQQQQQQQQQQQEQRNQQPQTCNEIMEEDGGEEEDVFAGISIDVNPVEGDFTRGCFVLPQDMYNTFRNAGRRNEEELASWPGKIDVLTQRYNNANIIRRMAIKKILHDITLATVRTSSLSPTTTVTPLQLQPHHTFSATNININNSNQRHYQQSQQQQHISMSPITTTSFASGGNTSVSNGESPPLHFTNIYGSQSARPPSLGNTPTPPPPNSIPVKAATPHRLVLSVRGTKSLTSAKSGSSSAGCLAGGCSSGSSSNTGSKRDSMVMKKFCMENDEDESDPFTDFDDDNSASSSSGSYVYKIRHNNDTNSRKAQDGSMGSSVETKVVPLQPKGVRVKKQTANTRDNNNNNSGDDDFVFSDENNNGEEIKHRKTAISNDSGDRTSTTNGKNIFLQLRKFNDGNDMDIDNFADLEDNEDIVNDSGSEGDDDDFMGNGNSGMVDNKTRSSSFSRSRSTSLERASQPRIVMKPLKNVATNTNIDGGMKLTLRKFSNDDDDVDIDPFKDFDDDDDDFNDIEESENDTFINGNGAKQVPKIGYSPKDLELPTNLVTSLYKKNNMRHFNSNDDGQPKINALKKEAKHKKNAHHFATIRQDGTIVMDDENGDEEVYDPYAGFDDSVIVGYEDVFKNNPSECYDDFIDMDDNTDLVLKHRNGGGEFSDEENDEDISGLDLSNVDQLVIHKNMN